MAVPDFQSLMNPVLKIYYTIVSHAHYPFYFLIWTHIVIYENPHFENSVHDN